MTKSDLIEELAKRNPKLMSSLIEKVVDTIIEEIKCGLEHEKRVEFRGFGSFKTIKRNKRLTKNPKTNEIIEISERNNIYFRVGKKLKEMIQK